MQTTRLRPDCWNTFRIVESDCDLFDDGESEPVVRHDYQIQKTADCWRIRIVQCGATAQRIGPVSEVCNRDGEAMFGIACGRSVVRPSDRDRPKDRFYRNVRRIMKEKQLTNKIMAARCGLIHQNIHCYVYGANTPTSETAQMFANALNVSVASLWEHQ
jgi:hypothetical protein